MADVRHDPEKFRYEVLVDGEVVGHADYTVDGETLTVPSTKVDPVHQGNGYAGLMIEQLLQDAKRSGQAVVPRCPYVSAYIGKHSEHRDLVPEDRHEEFGL